MTPAATLISVVTALTAASATAQTQAREVRASGNPIVADGGSYSADPAPIVVDDTLHILAGRDEASPRDGTFVMNGWQLFSTRNAASGAWHHNPAFLRPEAVFAWAEPGHAYASQIVKGPDGRFYLYASVSAKDTPAYKDRERSVIGVAVADTISGPWRDAHPGGPIVGQLTAGAEKMINIDPTVILDEDGRVFMYWGTFGQLRGVELARDMVTLKGSVMPVSSLTGFFEAPWLMKRKGTYYLLYAGNKAGPDSPCTEAVYYACQAYGTASSPLGPWTYRGVFLKPVSSTTSHAGAVPFRDKWYLTYHTADADGGGHFRRSVAIDELRWDDAASPPRIMPLTPTRRPRGALPPTRNIAAAATPHASNQPIPVQYWLGATNDGLVRETPLPPDMWATWTPQNPPQQWLQFAWPRPVTISESRIWFWADQPAGGSRGVAPPKSWRIEYWNGRDWQPVAKPSDYPTSMGGYQTTRFTPVRTRCVRAVFDASGAPEPYAAVAVQEWQVLATKPAAPSAATAKSPACGKPPG